MSVSKRGLADKRPDDDVDPSDLKPSLPWMWYFETLKGSLLGTVAIGCQLDAWEYKF